MQHVARRAAAAHLGDLLAGLHQLAFVDQPTQGQRLVFRRQTAGPGTVLADLALGGGAILPAPEQTIYIFDEGHHLPDKALRHFSQHARLRSSDRWLEQLGRTAWMKVLASLWAQMALAGLAGLMAALLALAQALGLALPTALVLGLAAVGHAPRDVALGHV